MFRNRDLCKTVKSQQAHIDSLNTTTASQSETITALNKASERLERLLARAEREFGAAQRTIEVKEAEIARLHEIFETLGLNIAALQNDYFWANEALSLVDVTFNTDRELSVSAGVDADQAQKQKAYVTLIAKSFVGESTVASEE